MTRTFGACLLCLLFLFQTGSAGAQCSTPGQTPQSAFPVCGTNTFQQSTVPQCGGRRVGHQGCTSELNDLNPFWYKFTCYQGGTLGFTITPNIIGDDYDWAIYDVTGQDVNQVYVDASLTICDNWSGDGGLTGTGPQGTQLFVCDGPGKPRFSAMPTLTQGHNYLLLISHFTRTEDGYSLSFGGGSAVITDTTLPRLRSIEASCGGDILRVKLNKRMKCSSLTGTGSEFFITPNAATVVSATGFGCSGGFDTDSIELRLSTFLNPGTFTLHVKNGSDGNTLLDICDRALPATDSLGFILLPRTFTPMDSLAPLPCAPNKLRLVFRRAILCGSVAADGSDFAITGSYPVTITGAAGTCAAGATVSKEIVITLNAPLQTEGNFTLTLKQGSDGNTIFDECGEETPAGASLPFGVLDTVNADFTSVIGYGCVKDTISFSHPGGNRINSWNWSLDEGQTSTQQNPVATYTRFDVPKNIGLVVSNGFCSDSATATIELINYLKAGFSVLEDQCPNEPVAIANTSVGRQLSYWWTFGDGNSSAEETPAPIYAAPLRNTEYRIQLTVTDSFGCTDIARQKIIIYNSCYVAVPDAFTPNNDGRNDLFHVLNAVKAVDFEFSVYNRWGQLVFKSNNWKEGWNGKIAAMEQPTGVYVWFTRYTERDTGKAVFRKGTVLLMR